MNHTTRPGFSMIECSALVLVLSMIGMTMGPTLNQMRAQARGTISAANLEQIGVGGAMYAASNNGRLFSYSWEAGVAYTMPNGQVRTAADDQDAASRQNQEILQRMTGRFGSGGNRILNATGRIPHRRYNHLVLMDFLGLSPDTELFLDPSDASLISWHNNPLEYQEDNNSLPYGNGPVGDGEYDDDGLWPSIQIKQRWTFGSSYTSTISAWQPDFGVRYIPIISTPHLFTVSVGGNVPLAQGRNMSEVLAPSHKVWLFEEFDREAAGDPYFGYDHARPEKLMFDGSVNRWRSGDAHFAVVPEIDAVEPWTQIYLPLHQFPIPLGGLFDNTRIGQYYRWTNNGLGGIDYSPAMAPRSPRAR
ncbi:MAG: hypothetical protein JKX70_02045 [Phycisphaerales bacterium]|nr:hypothetical protein [Phycisphaerales bacterium]